MLWLGGHRQDRCLFRGCSGFLDIAPLVFPSGSKIFESYWLRENKATPFPNIFHRLRYVLLFAVVTSVFILTERTKKEKTGNSGHTANSNA